FSGFACYGLISGGPAIGASGPFGRGWLVVAPILAGSCDAWYDQIVSAEGGVLLARISEDPHARGFAATPGPLPPRGSNSRLGTALRRKWCASWRLALLVLLVVGSFAAVMSLPAPPLAQAHGYPGFADRRW